jgi:hypothetical protein
MTAIWWVVLLLLWLWVSPVYSQLLVAIGNVIFQTNPFNHDEMVFGSQDRCIKSDVYFDIRNLTTGEAGRGHFKFSADAERFHFNITIFLALFLATPFDGQIGKKFLYILVGWLVLLMTQSLDLFLQTQDNKLVNFGRMAQAQNLQPLAAIDHWLSWAGRYFLLVGNIVIPLLLWLFAGIPRLKSKVVANNDHLESPATRALTI